jgi:geranylgeranyl diphosphate synthase type I
MTATTLGGLQSRFGLAIDDEIRRWLALPALNSEFNTLLQYQLGYVDAEGMPASAGGKRFRPTLCLLACETAGGNWQLALPVAAAIELLHNFSLVHDDIEDHDPVRRHRPSLWRVWGEPQAINAGDAMFALAGRAVMESVPQKETTLRLARRFQETTLALTRGQFLDMRFERQPAVTPREYLEMITLKSAELIAFSLWAGAVTAGAEDVVAEGLHNVGIALGRAFQIIDDMLGIWGDPQLTGKEPAKDLHNRKKTLPTIVAWEAADPSQRQVLEGFFAQRHDDISSVVAILDATNTQHHCRDAVRIHRHAARRSLRESIPSGDGVGELEALLVELTE